MLCFPNEKHTKHNMGNSISATCPLHQDKNQQTKTPPVPWHTLCPPCPVFFVPCFFTLKHHPGGIQNQVVTGALAVQYFRWHVRQSANLRFVTGFDSMQIRKKWNKKYELPNPDAECMAYLPTFG